RPRPPRRSAAARPVPRTRRPPRAVPATFGCVPYMRDEDDGDLAADMALLEALEASGPLISPARMSRKQRYRYWWGRGEAAKQEFDHGARRRDGHAPWIDLFNRLVGQHGPDIA